MKTQVFKGISLIAGLGAPKAPLRGNELAQLKTIENGYLIIEGNEIAEAGPMAELKYEGEQVPDHTIVLPAWCDSHTHLVFAESREGEFVQKIQGAGYAEIAAAGGGILNSARKTAEYSEDRLFDLAWQRLQHLAKMGTGSVEIKSGYGLSVEGELKMLRVIKRLKEKSSMNIKATFLGAHAYPAQYKEDHEGYIKEIIDRMLPVIAEEGLADYIDAFCESGFFSPEETLRVCEAGKQYGLKPKLHVNQLNSIGGIEAGIEAGALSLDHLETVTERDIELLGKFRGLSTLLPGPAFFLRMQMPPARKMLDVNAAVALASDFNPGSSPSGNMNLVLSMACIQMKMLPEEAINAATINGAFAMEVADRTGSIVKGKRADLIFTKPARSLAYLPYAFGDDHIDRMMINGEFI
ncbi:MAG: imidazolonepropionase [Chitinophagaceae bacterium]|nr:imidazolonepropionase [Chitinophagaceae bacterium]